MSALSAFTFPSYLLSAHLPRSGRYQFKIRAVGKARDQQESVYHLTGRVSRKDGSPGQTDSFSPAAARIRSSRRFFIGIRMAENSTMPPMGNVYP